MKSIVVFLGGESVEHDVSVITGTLTLNSIDKSKYNPIPVYVGNDGVFYTGKSLFDVENYKNLDYEKLDKCFIKSGDNGLYKIIKNKKIKLIDNIYCAINCMHGERGEDGSLSGFLKLCKIPVCSPDILSSAISMDKGVTKDYLKGIKVKTLPYHEIKNESDITYASLKFGFPVIVKPATSGSSIGIGIANNLEEFKTAVKNAEKFSEKVIAEKLLEDFFEINCAAYRGRNGKVITSPCEQPVLKDKILSFSDKYNGGERIFPAGIKKEISDKIRKITEKVYEKLSFNGIIRIDYLIKGKDIFLNEINSVPGSLSYYLFTDTFKGFSEILNEIIEETEKRFLSYSQKERKFSSSVLDIKSGKGTKRL